MRRIGILGCGNIAEILTDYDLGGEVVAVFDRHDERAAALAERFGAEHFTDFTAFMDAKPDLVIECASVSAVISYALSVLQNGADLLVLSAGAFANASLLHDSESIAQRHGQRLYIPSGAYFGMDNAKIGRFGGIERIRVKTLKPPEAFRMESDETRCLFSGSAAACIVHYPRNANAAVALSLNARRDVFLELWVNPDATQISHELFFEGVFGTAHIRIDNTSSAQNPSTSFLAALSVVALVENFDETVLIGS